MATYNAGSAEISISPSLRNFANELRSRLQGINADYEVDVGADLTRFRAQLEAELANQREVDIVVNLNTGDTAARLDYLTRNRDINLDLQLNPAQLAQIQAQIAALGIGNIGIQVASSAGGFSSLTSVAGVALATVGALAAVSFIPLIASASQALGVLALFPAVASGGVAAIAALGIGMSGITGAFSAMGESAGGAGGAAEDMGHKTAQAAERVEDAKISLRNAEERLADSQNDARAAQNDLNDSYAEGVRQLRDMNDELDSSKLSTEGADLALVRARERQREVNSRSDSTGTDRWAADLDVREAEERLEQQKRQTNELAQDTARANREGVDGTDAVVSAKERLNSANKAEEQAAQQVRQSQNALTEALYQQANASTAAAGGVDKFAEAMAKLSPNAQDFVLKVRSLGDAWTDLRKSVQDNLFDGLGDSIVNLADDYFPILKTGLGEIATQFNGGLKQIFAEMSSPRVKDQWSNILNNTSIAVGNLMGAFSNMGRAFTTIASVGSDFLPGLTQGLEDSTGRFADWIDKLADNGKLKQWIQDAIDKFGELWNIGEQIVELIRNIFSGSKEEGDGMLEGISKTLDRWNEFLGSEEGQKTLSNFFKEVRESMQEIFEIVEATAGLISDLKTITDAVGLTGQKPKNPEGTEDSNDSPANSKRLKDKDGNTVDSKGNPAYNPGEGPLTSWIPVVPKDSPGGAIAGFGKEVQEAGNLQALLAQKTEGAWNSMSKTISEKWTQNILPTLQGFGRGALDLGETARREIAEKAGQAWDSLAGAAGRVGQFVRERLTDLMNGFSELPGRIGGAVSGVVSGGFQNLQNGATNVKEWVSGRFDDMVTMITGLPARITLAAGNMFDGIKEAFRGALNWIIKAWNDFKIEMKIPKSVPVIGGRGFTIETPDLNPLADGGAVTGPGGPRDDLIPAMLSNGEFVINAAATSRNLPLLHAINSGVRGYADGGVVLNDSEITTGIQQTMWDAVRTEFPNVELLSGTRYVDVGSGFDHHMGGQALDLSPDPNIARWIYGLNPTQPVEELIHWPLDGWENLKSGSPLDYGASTNAQHEDHVHWAMTSFTGATPAVPAPVDTNPYVPTTGADQVPGWSTTDPGGLPSTDPGAYAPGSSSSSPTSWSQVAGIGASAFASGMVSDLLGVLGIPDGLPPAAQAYNQWQEGQKQQTQPTAPTTTPPTTAPATPPPAAVEPVAPPAPAAPPIVYDVPEGGIAEGSPGAKDAVWAVWQGLGWTGDQWLDTLRLVNGESSWDESAANPSSTAEGLFQFLDMTRAAYGYGPTAAEQAGPGAAYITDRYGTPSDAWAFWSSQSPHWYANGGPVVGPGGPRDDAIPAFLSNGEYVVNSMAARQNLPILEAINSGQRVGGGVTNVTNNNVSTARVEDAFYELRNMQDRQAAMSVSRFR